MVRSSLLNGLFAGFRHFPSANLGTQLIKLHGTPFCDICCPARTSLWPSRHGYWAGLGPKVPLPFWTSPMPYPSGVKPPHLCPEEEAWLDVHLDKLVAKGVIGPILPGEQPWCITPLLLVPRRIVWAALPGVSKHCPSQQTDGWVPVPTQ